MPVVGCFTRDDPALRVIETAGATVLREHAERECRDATIKHQRSDMAHEPPSHALAILTLIDIERTDGTGLPWLLRQHGDDDADDAVSIAFNREDPRRIGSMAG